MAKFYGVIGYVETKETKPGVWGKQITEREYFGDLLRNIHKNQTSGQVNDNVNIANQISIVSDDFAYTNFQFIKYVVFMGTKWKITDVEVKYPRLILTMGGVYNE